MPSVTVVGLGVGPEDLTQQHKQAIEKAEVLVGGKRQLALFAGPTEAVWVLGTNPTATLEEVKEQSSGKRVVILASGDPLFFGIGKRTLEVFGPDKVVFLPNITALQKACARLKIPWDGVVPISVHGREPTDFFSDFARPGVLAIYTDPKNTPDRLAALLLDFGMPNRRLAVVEEIGSDDERLRETDLATAVKESFAPLNIMIIYPVDGDWTQSKLGLEDDVFFKEKSLITKQEPRALILAELRLGPAGVMWDVGAGSGSVGIEAVRIAPGLRVYAVEKKQARLEMIQENVHSLAGFGVKPILGKAPDSLLDLPDPDRVFVGGSGGMLKEILQIVEERLKPEGRVVVSIVTPETLGRAQDWLQKTGLAHKCRLLQVSRTIPIQPSSDRGERAFLSRFQPQTPLFLLSLWKA